MRGHEDQSSGGDPAPPNRPDFGDEFFEGMVAAASDAVVTMDADGTVVYANEAVEDLLGYAPDDLLGRSFVDFVPERHRDRYDGWFDRDTDGDGETPFDDDTFDVTWRTADGAETRFSMSGFVHESDDRPLFTGFIREAPDGDATDERLREEEALVEELFDTSPVAISVRDADGELLRANDRAAELVGVDSDELSAVVENDQEDVKEWSLYDADGNPREHPVEQTLRTGEPLYNEEIIVERPEGDRAHLSASVTPIYDDGEVERVVTAAEDITELKETQHALERRRAELATELAEVFTRIDDAFFALNDEWEFTYVNDEAEERLRRTEGELIGRTIWEEFPEAVDSTFEREYREAMATQQQVSFVEYYPPLSAWFEVRAYPSETGLSVYFRDVTGRIERERGLERYETIVETVGDGIYVVGPDGTLSMVNSAFERITGYDESELLGRSPSMFYDDEIEAFVGEAQREMIEGDRSSATVEHDLETASGETIFIESTFVVRPADDGTESDYERIGVLRDVTERKEREAELEWTRKRFEKVFEASQDAIFINDPFEDEIVDANPAGCELLGWSREELTSRGPSDFHPDEMDEFREFVGEVYEEGSGWTDELTCLHGDGHRIPVEMSASQIEFDGRKRMVAIVRDITDRKRFEQTLTALHESSRELLQLETEEAVSESVLQTTTDVLGIPGAGIYLWDDEAAELTPAAASEHATDIFGDLPSLGSGDEAITWRAFTEGETITFDDVAETDLTYREDTPLRSGLWIPLGDHGVLAVVSEEVGAFGPDDEKLADLLAATTEAALDRVERERERREHERALEAQNERLDAFASMLAHELRNPLEIAQIYLDMGVERAVADDADDSAFEEVGTALDRIEEMIETLLVVTRRGGEVDTTEVVDLGQVAADWWADLDPDGNLSVETDRKIRADDSRLRQLLENLYRNAVEHGSTSNQPEADDAEEHAGPDVTVRVGDLQDGFYVEDDGEGIPEDERGRVFEPGYSTSNVGIGFGLAVVRQLVDAHGWQCEITESPEGGARFEFTNVETVGE